MTKIGIKRASYKTYVVRDLKKKIILSLIYFSLHSVMEKSLIYFFCDKYKK